MDRYEQEINELVHLFKPLNVKSKDGSFNLPYLNNIESENFGKLPCINGVNCELIKSLEYFTENSELKDIELYNFSTHIIKSTFIIVFMNIPVHYIVTDMNMNTINEICKFLDFMMFNCKFTKNFEYFGKIPVNIYELMNHKKIGYKNREIYQLNHKEIDCNNRETYLLNHKVKKIDFNFHALCDYEDTLFRTNADSDHTYGINFDDLCDLMKMYNPISNPINKCKKVSDEIIKINGRTVEINNRLYKGYFTGDSGPCDFEMSPFDFFDVVKNGIFRVKIFNFKKTVDGSYRARIILHSIRSTVITKKKLSIEDYDRVGVYECSNVNVRGYRKNLPDIDELCIMSHRAIDIIKSSVHSDKLKVWIGDGRMYIRYYNAIFGWICVISWFDTNY